MGIKISRCFQVVTPKSAESILKYRERVWAIFNEMLKQTTRTWQKPGKQAQAQGQGQRALNFLIKAMENSLANECKKG